MSDSSRAFRPMIALVISLAERGAARRKRLLPRLAELGVPHLVIDAVDGRQLAQSDLPVSEEGSAAHLQGRAGVERITTNEVACLLSHRKAWQAVLSMALPYALILEDDAWPEVGQHEIERLTHRVLHMRPDMLTLQLTPNDLTDAVRKDYGEFVELCFAPMGAYGYVVTAAGAEALLDLSAKLEKPSDCYLRELSQVGAGCFIYRQPVILHGDQGHSLILEGRSGIILGLGTGRCGTKSVAQIFNRQENCVGFHERLRAPWHPDPAWSIFVVERLVSSDGTGSWPHRFEGASWYLHYAVSLLDRLPTLKVVVTERPKEEVVASFLRITACPYRNHWQPHAQAHFDPYFTCFPSYDPGQKKETAVARYVDEYYGGVDFLASSYPSRVRRVQIDELNDIDAIRDLLFWSGVKPTNPAPAWIS